MAAVGKKKKTTWKPINATVLIDQTRPTSLNTNWADEVAKEIDGNIMETRIPPKVELPTAPRASRGSAIDESKIPTIGPFQAYLSNIPYDLNEEELIAFFQDLKVKNVKLPKEEKTSRAKGFGYIEFEDRADLSAALSLGDTMLKGRVIKIDLPNHADMGGRGNRGRGNRDGGRDQHSSDRTTGNWRSGPRADDFEDRGGYDRGYGGRRDYGGGGGGSGGGGSGFSRGGFDREERGFYRDDRERFDRGGRDDRGRDDRSGGGGGFRERYDRDRGFGGRDREGYSYNDRGFRERGRDDDRYSRNEERGAGGGSSSGQWRDEPRENRGFGGGGGGGGGRGGFEERRDRDREGGKFGPPPRRDEPPMDRGGGGGSSESRNRPKLQLQPRTKPKEVSLDTPSASASIFGGAKPVDTAAREREIEERLMRSEDFSDASYRSSRSGPGSTGSRGGGERGEKQWEPAEKRVEPAPPPKENAWSKKAPQTIVNNGRSSPEDDGSRSNIDSDERSHDESRSTRTGDESRGSLKGPGSAEKARGKESERHTNKQRDGKESPDDISKMPKVPESKTPNFAGSNKYSTLDDSEEASNE